MMASVNLSGILTRPSGEPDVGAVVRFTHYSTTGNTVKTSYDELVIPPDGTYNYDLEYGNVRIDYLSDYQRDRFIAIVTVNQDTTATSIPELLNAAVPPTDEQLLEFQVILGDAVAAKNAAELAAETAANQITTLELIASSVALPVGSVIETSGFTTKGDGGGARWQLTAVTSTPSQTPSQLGDALLNDASGRQWELVFDSYISVRSVGVPYLENDGVNSAGNYSAHIQAGYDALKNNGGGDLDLCVGKIPFADTLYFGEGDSVTVVGYGRGTIQNSKVGLRASAKTRLYYTGAGANGVVITSDRDNTGAKPKRGGGGIVDVMIDGGEKAAKGLQVLSHSGSRLKIGLCYWAGGMFESNVLSNGTIDAPSDTQEFSWDIQTADVNTSNEGEYHILLHGRDSENTSLGVIERLSINCETNAVGAHFGDVDGTLINFIQSGIRTGVPTNPDAGKIILHADDTLPPSVGDALGYCRNITFVRAELTKGITARATVGGVFSSRNNIILNMSGGNGSPAPVVESGAILNYIRDSGPAKMLGHVKTVLGTTDGNVISAASRVGSESVRITNGSNAHVVLENTAGTKTASINLSDSTGNMRLASATGSIELNSKILLSGQTSSLGAPAAATNKLQISINGSTYYIPLTLV